MEHQLHSLPGVTYVEADPRTGDVLILYDGKRIEEQRLLGALRFLGYMRQ
jgi:copper chaperone CopZ